ncbi:hypothetical protein M409DRAFT_29728 [Zasmidium cellare ATCC 36951]|uniref:NAD dependent epimerase/dehydratase n=1 Tax=Zasmidium cellare ATCC 36951 TaxID=1080233 RepID=A0A6A6C2T7_ZASCE|nr:uncharacterized protein M409DRAFT_29728 [Zasmidium cellare ATCC 36951]KAF2159726.1 hypothetical protein M409DRAFT_29728 [Zasmidium cellare ATCC 36951]
MKAALQILGHKNVHHGYELYVHPEQCDSWRRAWDAKAKPNSSAPFTARDWDELLGPYSAVTDMPAACFGPELIAAYPEAKVILSVRDVDAWYESFNTGVIETFWDNQHITGAMTWLDPELIRPVHQMWHRLFGDADGYFAATNREEMQRNSKAVYERHNSEILKVCPSEKRLRFEVKDGWEPLCGFLGVPVPDQPFPRVNEGEAVKEVVATYMRRSMTKVGRNLAIGVVVLGLSIQGLRMVMAG